MDILSFTFTISRFIQIEVEVTSYSFFIKCPLLGETFISKGGVVHSSWREVRTRERGDNIQAA